MNPVFIVLVMMQILLTAQPLEKLQNLWRNTCLKE